MKLSKILLMSTFILIASGAGIAAHIVALYSPPDVEVVMVSQDAVKIANADLSMPIVTAYCDPDWNQVPKHEEVRVFLQRAPVGDPYLVRSQSWIRNNNLAANGRLHIFILEFSHARSIA